MKKRILGLLVIICMLAATLVALVSPTQIQAKKKKVKLNYTSYELKEGLQFQLSLTGATAKSFKSSDKNIVKVTKKGLVSAVSIGNATITVKASNGKSYKCQVSVIYNKEFHIHTIIKVPGKKATCTEQGLTIGEKCDTCGEIFTNQTVIPATGHDYDENGICRNCKEKDPNYKPPHVHTYVSDSKEPTCTTAGYTEKVYCPECGQVFLASKELKALGHNYSGGFCTRCGAPEVHEYVTVAGVNPTCTDPGRTESVYCKICGDILKESVIIEPLGHEYNDGDNCIRCGADRHGHIHKWVIEKKVAATCTEPGLTEGKYCQTCGYRAYAQQFTDPLGHNYVNGKCTRCGKKQ